MEKSIIVSSEVNVPAIIQKYKDGSTRDYDLFVSKLTNDELDSPSLVACLQGLKECVSILDRDYETLISVILKIGWTLRETAVIQEYQAFILNLLSAHTFYLKACLRSFVRLFLPKHSIADSVSTDQKQTHDDQCLVVHGLIKSITQVVPMTATVLLPMLSNMFPYMTKDTYIQECYVKNILRITQYLPTNRKQILEIVLDRMLKLDVRSPRHEIQECENLECQEDMMDEAIFDMDDSACVIPSVVMATRPSSMEDGGPMSHKEADRLDTLMVLLFTFVQGVCYPNGNLHWEETKKLYKEILYIFDKIILSTHASCHVQFIMFYICSFRRDLCEGFIDYLWKKVQDPNTESIFRQASVSYISSIVARATYVPLSTATMCINLMCQWIHRYIENITYATSTDTLHHGPFYSICQALFYVFAFRNKEIFESRKGRKFAKKLGLQTIVTCRLNPLRVCLPTVVKTFSSVTRMHQLAFCDTIIERNSRNFLPIVSANTSCPSRLSLVNALDSFFPFDPYLLSRSRKFVLPLYREYEGNVLEEDDSDNESQEDDFLPEVQSTTERPESWKNTDPMDYGVSPGFKKVLSN